MEYFLYIPLGMFAGLMAGLFGIGGGLIIVPALAAIFSQQGYDSSSIMHLAIGTSLATIIFTSISSINAHHKKQAVLWSVVHQLAPGIFVGAMAGGLIAHLIPTKNLQWFFAIFEFYVAVQMLQNFKPDASRQLPKGIEMFSAGSIIGSISSLVGIGGGTLTVPFLVWCNQSIHKAIATSAACGLPIAIAGTLGFMISGWNQVTLPNHSIGYIHIPSLLGIVSSSILFAPLGAKLAHSLPVVFLKRIFSGLLFLLAFYMLDIFPK